MRLPFVPTPLSIAALTGLAVCSVLALGAGVPHATVAIAAAAVLLAALTWAAWDVWYSAHAWRHATPQWQRPLPFALALGVRRTVTVTLVNPGPQTWQIELFDNLGGSLDFEGLPRRDCLPARARLDVRYHVTPRQRGRAEFGATQLRVRTLGGSFDLLRSLGEAAVVQVYPNFAAVARYAWLAGDRRLTEIGVRTVTQRGAGTDFKQLSDYQVGDPIRHIDWRASLRHHRPVVREFQDERDQCVLFLLDCGRRMRADEGQPGTGGSHFDQALNALMLMAYVALKEGDEVGAMTFGLPPGQARHFAPRKGIATLNAMMARLHDIEPCATHADYVQAAQALLKAHPKRALVVVVTNFRDEDAAELKPALHLLRRRHLVLVSSLRERVLREIGEQGLNSSRDAVEAATAHLFEQSRRDAFRRVTGHDALSVDVEPAQLAVALVNQYYAVKRAGLL